MKIMLLCDHFGTGGGAGRVAQLLAEQLAGSHELVVLSANSPENYKAQNFILRSFGLEYSLFWRNYLGLWHPRAVKTLSQELRNWRPDVVLIHNLHTFWSYSVLALLKREGIKTILTIHDVSAFTPYVKLCNIKEGEYQYPRYRHIRDAKLTYNPVRNWIIKRKLGLAGAVVCVSHELREALSQNGIKSDKVIHNGFPDVGTGLGAVSDAPAIFFSGRLSSSKGMFQAVDYLLELKNRHGMTPKLKLAALEGAATEKMRSYAARVGVADQLEFLGWLEGEQYARALASCAVVISPSICFDSFPTAVLEAMAYHKPVVASPLGGAKEMIDQGKTGYVVDPLDIRQFSQRLYELISDRKKAEEMGRAGGERVREEFSLDKMEREYISLVNEI